MSGDRGESTGRRPTNALLAVCCLVAVVLLAGVVPGVSMPFGDQPAGESGTEADAIDPDAEGSPGEEPVDAAAVGGLPGDSPDGEGIEAENGDADAGSGDGGTDPISDAIGSVFEGELGEGSEDTGEAPDGDALESATGAESQPSVTDETRIDGNAEFTAANEELFFTVEADRPAYWRTTAYDTYDGDGWVSSDDGTYDDDVQMAGDREILEQRVTAQAPSSAVPAAWQPVETATVGPGTTVSHDSEGGLQAEGGMEAGETVEVESVLPATDSETLDAAGEDYPDDVENRYTALPDDVPDRVEDRTAEITSDAETPYETAMTVEAYLQSEYDYELDVPPPEGDVADEMLFEREEAYCAYFASTMTVMLRSEGVPARYTTGYNSGEYVGDDEYEVRGMHAHAWVEVYFPGAGWVPFEPTPADDRADALEAETSQQDGMESFDHGSHGGEEDFGDSGEFDDGAFENGEEAEDPSSEDDEWGEDEFGGEDGWGEDDDGAFENGEVDDDSSSEDDPFEDPDETEDDDAPDGDWEEDGDDDATEEESDDTTEEESDDTTEAESDDATEDESDDAAEEDTSYEVTADPEPAPGEEVTITITRDDEPAPDRTVTFDGDPVGETDADGQVTATIPYTEELAVGVESGDSTGSIGSPDAAGAPFYSGWSGGSTVASAGNDSTVFSFTSEIDVTAESDDLVPGEGATIVATIDDRPVPDAAVTLDDEAVAETDADGEATVETPDRENATVAVERGDLSGQTTLDVAALSIDLDASPVPVTLPGTSATVTVTDDEGDPVAETPVTVDGEQAGETDGDGTATAPIPSEPSASVGAGQDGQLASTTVYPLVNAVLVGLGGLLALAGAIVASRRLDRSYVRRAVGAPMALCRYGLTLIVLGSRGLDRLLTGALDGIRVALGSVDAAIAALRRGASRIDALARRLWRFLGRIPSLLTVPTLLAAIRGLRSGPPADGAGTAGTSDESGPETGTEGGGGSRKTRAEIVRAAWYRLIELVGIRNVETHTPREVASRAVDAGLPDGPVETVLSAFRSVEYGERTPDGRTVERVREASETVQCDGESE